MANKKQLRILRGTTSKIASSTETLAPGQLLYNETKNYLTCGKSGNEETPINSLPIACAELVAYEGDGTTVGQFTTEIGSIRGKVEGEGEEERQGLELKGREFANIQAANNYVKLKDESLEIKSPKLEIKNSESKNLLSLVNQDEGTSSANTGLYIRNNTDYIAFNTNGIISLQTGSTGREVRWPSGGGTLALKTDHSPTFLHMISLDAGAEGNAYRCNANIMLPLPYALDSSSDALLSLINIMSKIDSAHQKVITSVSGYAYLGDKLSQATSIGMPTMIYYANEQIYVNVVYNNGTTVNYAVRSANVISCLDTGKIM